jgi:uncharacterized membrane protein
MLTGLLGWQHGSSSANYSLVSSIQGDHFYAPIMLLLLLLLLLLMMLMKLFAA